MPIWTFEPVYPESWAASAHRVLLLGAEPNGDTNYGGLNDMGAWFREAEPPSYNSGGRFYVRNIAQLAGALGQAQQHWPDEGTLTRAAVTAMFHQGVVEGLLGGLRYADLKATQGDASADLDEVRGYVEDNLDEVLSFWMPPGVADPHQPPTITVIQGGIARQVFAERVLPELRRRGVEGHYVGMPHPSEQRSYESLRCAAHSMAAQLAPLPAEAVRWGSLRGQPGWLTFP
ncbi:MAG: hypothetical protein H6742_15320 [Alphaproteobacteria bacterium]|nr:hypothetical protein [Alphaproteobacteria bacterium]